MVKTAAQGNIVNPDQEFLQILVGIQHIIANPIRDQGGKCSVTCSIGTVLGMLWAIRDLTRLYTRSILGASPLGSVLKAAKQLV